MVELGLVLEQGDVAIFPDAGVAEADHLLAQQEFGRLPAILLDGAIGLVQIVPVTQLFQPLPNRDVFGMREGQRQDDLRIHREHWQVTWQGFPFPVAPAFPRSAHCGGVGLGVAGALPGPGENREDFHLTAFLAPFLDVSAQGEERIVSVGLNDQEW